MSFVVDEIIWRSNKSLSISGNVNGVAKSFRCYNEMLTDETGKLGYDDGCKEALVMLEGISANVDSLQAAISGAVDLDAIANVKRIEELTAERLQLIAERNALSAALADK